MRTASVANALKTCHRVEVAERKHETPVDANFAANMKRRRIDLGMSQADLAQAMQDQGFHNIHPTAIRRIETGDRSVKLGEAKALSFILREPLERLMWPSATLFYVEEVAKRLREFTVADKQLYEAVTAWHDARAALWGYIDVTKDFDKGSDSLEVRDILDVAEFELSNALSWQTVLDRHDDGVKVAKGQVGDTRDGSDT